MRNNVSPSLESGGKRTMELGSKQLYLPCFGTTSTTPGSPRTTSASQSIIIYASSPTIFPTNFICLTQCAPIIALNGSTTTTIITPAKFYGELLIIPPPICSIYGIALLVTVLLLIPILTVVLIPLPQLIAPPRRVYDIYQRYILTDILHYYSIYFVPFMKKHVY